MLTLLLLLAAAPGAQTTPPPPPTPSPVTPVAVYTVYYWVDPETTLFTPDTANDAPPSFRLYRNANYALPPLLMTGSDGRRFPSCQSLAPGRWWKLTTTIHTDATITVEAVQEPLLLPTTLRCP